MNKHPQPVTDTQIVTPVEPQPVEVIEPAPVVQPEPEKELLKWHAPARLYKKRDREYFTTVGVLVILVSVILLFAKEFILIGVVLAFAFVSYALASVPPENTEHILTNKGVRTGEKLYTWDLLGRFWFEDKWKQELVQIEHYGGFPGQLTLILPTQVSAAEVEEILGQYLIKEKPLPTPIEKAATWLQEKVPLETES